VLTAVSSTPGRTDQWSTLTTATHWASATGEDARIELGHLLGRAAVAALDGQFVSRIRRMAASDSWALGTNPATGLSAITSA